MHFLLKNAFFSKKPILFSSIFFVMIQDVNSYLGVSVRFWGFDLG